MAPKNERFEMRVDEDLLARIDGWRAQQPDVPARTEAVRRLIEVGLAPASPDDIHLSDGEKLLIVMMGDLYKTLKIRDGEVDPTFIAKAMYGGHYWAPRWEMTGLFHRFADDPTRVRFVVDVLDMWTFIEHAYGKLAKKEKDRIEKEIGPYGEHLGFSGFDGNNETDLMGIVRFLVEQMGRFQTFKGRDFNSHAPMAGEYRRMLRAFEPIRPKLAGGGLDATQIITILKALDSTQRREM